MISDMASNQSQDFSKVITLVGHTTNTILEMLEADQSDTTYRACLKKLIKGCDKLYSPSRGQGQGHRPRVTSPI